MHTYMNYNFSMNKLLHSIWYGKHPLQYLLYPFSLIYQWIAKLRRKILTPKRSALITPVIIVGNINVGGTGKTPLVLYLCELLKQNGYHPGIISRGYTGSNPGPLTVTENSDVSEVGDEALLMAKRSQCPLVIGRKRLKAMDYLLEHHNVDIIISDDGLQHYQLPRTIEIAVIDGQRRFGNGFCLPAGPLREAKSRLNEVDFIVVNGQANPNEFEMQYQPMPIKNLKTAHALNKITEPMHAVAGIGNPEKFFKTLQQLEINFIPQPFPDHHRYTATDFSNMPNKIIMTEKDAVKCQAFADDNIYVLPISATLPPAFDKALLSKLPRP